MIQLAGMEEGGGPKQHTSTIMFFETHQTAFIPRNQYLGESEVT